MRIVSLLPAGMARFDPPPPEQLLAKLNRNAGLVSAAALGGIALQGQVRLQTALDRDTLELEHGLTLIRIPAGRFQMGSDDGANDEQPVHTVTLAREFWMSQTEITFDQYDAYVAAQPKIPQPDDRGWGRGHRPVINVSWEDAQGYVQWLTASQHESLQGLQCRLPSEAEWEYAARAGTTSAYFWGDEIGSNKANCDGCGSQWDNQQTAPVGSFAANVWDLHDMHGNVWEWVQDCHANNYQNTPVDGSAHEPADCAVRVLRGGSWLKTPAYLRSADRDSSHPDLRSDLIGFRVVCSSPSER
ncbi:MAG: formylglycine-generating enzyme family protein [Thiolinea sp.]